MPRKRVRRNERDHGQGSIKTLPDGRVRAWRPPKPHPTDPTRRARPSRLFEGKDARRRAEAWLAGIEPGPSMTWATWAEIWYTRREATLRETSRRRYRQYFALLTPIADRPLDQLGADEWQLHINRLLDTHARTTIDRARGIWSAALSAAVRAGHLSANPLLETILPTPDEQPPKAWTAGELRRLLAAARGHHHEAFLHLGHSTGLRLGEMRALEWRDIDFEELTVTVSKSMNNDSYKVGPTKTGRTRLVPLPAEAAQILSAHAKRQLLGTTLVIGRPGGAYHPSTLRAWLQRLCKTAGVTPLTPHALRHTFASQSLADGVDLPALSQVLGHANVIITATVYAHFITRRDRPTAKAISRRIYGSGPSAHNSAHTEGDDQEKSARV